MISPQIVKAGFRKNPSRTSPDITALIKHPNACRYHKIRRKEKKPHTLTPLIKHRICDITGFGDIYLNIFKKAALHKCECNLSILGQMFLAM